MKKKLLISIPAYNEAVTIADVIEAIPRNFAGVDSVDILVVDDGSGDDTAEIATRSGTLVISHGRNLGLGAAFRTALSHARKHGYHFLATLDGDGQFNPVHLSTLLTPVINDKIDLVTASRFADPELIPEMPRIKIWGNRRVAKLVSRLSGIRIKDATCGFRVYGPAALERLSTFSKFTYTQEVIIDLASKGLRIKEVPVKIRGERAVGKSRVAGNLWRYAILSLAAMYSTAHDHKPWHFYGIPALILMVIGFSADIFVFFRWLITGSVTPFAGVAIAGLFFITFGILLLLVASLADTASHNRHLIEEVNAEIIRRNRTSQLK